MSSRFAKGASKLAIVRASGDWVLGGLGVGAATASASFAAYMLAFGPNELVPGGGFTIFAAYDHRPQVAQPSAGPTHGDRAAGQVAEGSPARAEPAAPEAVDFTPTGFHRTRRGRCGCLQVRTRQFTQRKVPAGFQPARCVRRPGSGRVTIEHFGSQARLDAGRGRRGALDREARRALGRADRERNHRPAAVRPGRSRFAMAVATC